MGLWLASSKRRLVGLHMLEVQIGTTHFRLKIKKIVAPIVSDLRLSGQQWRNGELNMKKLLILVLALFAISVFSPSNVHAQDSSDFESELRWASMNVRVGSKAEVQRGPRNVRCWGQGGIQFRAAGCLLI